MPPKNELEKFLPNVKKPCLFPICLTSLLKISAEYPNPFRVKDL